MWKRRLRSRQHARAERRIGILSAHRAEILDDCERALLPISYEWARECRNAITAMRADLDGPAQSHASNIIDSIVLRLHGSNGRNHVRQSALETLTAGRVDTDRAVGVRARHAGRSRRVTRRGCGGPGRRCRRGQVAKAEPRQPLSTSAGLAVRAAHRSCRARGSPGRALAARRPAVPRLVPSRCSAGLAAPHDLVPAARMRHRPRAVAWRPAHDHPAWSPRVSRLAPQRIRPPARHPGLHHASGRTREREPRASS
jgi:hypothetical protein